MDGTACRCCRPAFASALFAVASVARSDLHRGKFCGSCVSSALAIATFVGRWVIARINAAGRAAWPQDRRDHSCRCCLCACDWALVDEPARCNRCSSLGFTDTLFRLGRVGNVGSFWSCVSGCFQAPHAPNDLADWAWRVGGRDRGRHSHPCLADRRHNGDRFKNGSVHLCCACSYAGSVRFANLAIYKAVVLRGALGVRRHSQ